MAGGKGGSSTTKVPAWVEEAGQRNLARANEISQTGYVPYYGPDVAAQTPLQQAAIQNTAGAAGAFGMAGAGMTGMEGMPQAQQMAGGGYGYSSAPIYEQSVNELQARAPGQYDFIRSMFINPVTGERPAAPFGPGSYSVGGGTGGVGGGTGGTGGVGGVGGGIGEGGGWACDPSRDYAGSAGGGISFGGNEGERSHVAMGGYQGPTQSGQAGYSVGLKDFTGPKDMIDGGGPGASADKVICTALHSLGLLPDDIYALDAEFGQRVNREDPALGDGYRLWATPIAEYIKGDSLGSLAVRAVVAPIATAWAKQMAHVMRPNEYKPNLIGKALMAVGHPVCRAIGNLAKAQEA